MDVALRTRDKLQELCGFLERASQSEELDPPLVTLLDQLSRHTHQSANALTEYLRLAAAAAAAAASEPDDSAADGADGAVSGSSAADPPVAAAAAAAAAASHRATSRRKRGREQDGSASATSTAESPQVQVRTHHHHHRANKKKPRLAAPPAMHKMENETPHHTGRGSGSTAHSRRRNKLTVRDKQEQKVHRLMQQCAKLKERAQTAEHTLKANRAQQLTQQHKSKESERTLMLSHVERICRLLNRQRHQQDSPSPSPCPSPNSSSNSSPNGSEPEQHTLKLFAVEQALVSAPDQLDVATLSEARQWVHSPKEARATCSSMQTAEAVERYNRHAAFGRKMSLHARFICGVLAARFWDGTNAAGAKQERAQVDATTASHLGKWCAAGHLHTSMKVMLAEIRFALVCDLFPDILLLAASEFPWTLFAEHSASWLDAFRQAATRTTSTQPPARLSSSTAPLLLLKAAGLQAVKADAVELASLFDGRAGVDRSDRRDRSPRAAAAVQLQGAAVTQQQATTQTRAGASANDIAILYFEPRHLGDEYVWDELEIVEVKDKGQGVRARVDVPKGKCLPVYGVEIPDEPYPTDTRYLLDMGKNNGGPGRPRLLDLNPLHAPDDQRGLFIAGKVNEPSKHQGETANVVAVFDPQLQRAVFRAVEDIAAGHELLFDYGRHFDRSDRDRTVRHDRSCVSSDGWSRSPKFNKYVSIIKLV